VRVDAPTAQRSARLPLIDAARGIAVAAMVVYHFSWDLRYFGFIAADVEGDLGWRLFARSIAASFIFIVGVSLVLSTRSGLDPARFLRRLAIIAGAAVAITVVTWFVFPDSFIFFGILHHIAVASVLGLPFVSAPIAVTAAASALCFVIPSLLAGPALDHPWLLWLGLSTYAPRSNDFVPLFPWFGVALAGIAATRMLPLLPACAARLGEFGKRTPEALIWAGRHSLGIYLLHQPLLFGLLYLVAQVAPPDLLGFESAYIESCTVSCAEAEVEPGLCRTICQCVAERTQGEGLWASLMRETLTDQDAERYVAITDACSAEFGVQ
jgi:uncharacterized membrane protein